MGERGRSCLLSTLSSPRSAVPGGPPPCLMAMGSLFCLSVFFFSFLKVYANNFFKPNRNNTHASSDPFNTIPLSPVNPETPAVTSLGESFQKYSMDTYTHIYVYMSLSFFYVNVNKEHIFFWKPFFFLRFLFFDMDHF